MRTNGEVMKMIDGVASGNAWVVGRFDVLSKQANLPAEVQSQMPQVTWFSATGHVNGGVAGTVTVEARDEEAAKNLRAVVGGFIGLAKMQAASKPELSALVQSINAERRFGHDRVGVVHGALGRHRGAEDRRRSGAQAADAGVEAAAETAAEVAARAALKSRRVSRGA